MLSSHTDLNKTKFFSTKVKRTRNPIQLRRSFFNGSYHNMNKSAVDDDSITSLLKNKPGKSPVGRGTKILPLMDFNFDEDIGTLFFIFFYNFYM